MKLKAFGDGSKKGLMANGQFLTGATPNPDFKFSKISGDSDFHLMISKDQEEMHKKLSEENAELRDCLRMLQHELMEIIALK